MEVNEMSYFLSVAGYTSYTCYTSHSCPRYICIYIDVIYNFCVLIIVPGPAEADGLQSVGGDPRCGAGRAGRGRE